ncbi:MAG TPA: hypothetical protein VGN22_06960, partial [Pseudonocardia sp.]
MTSDQPDASAATTELALSVIDAARARSVPLRLLGGRAVHVLCREFPPRTSASQDIDLAAYAKDRRAAVTILSEVGLQPDRNFNAVHGHRQLYFTTPDGHAVDVMLDQLTMCHVLPFAGRLERTSYTLDPTDLLLSKLQVVEQNEKDLHDITQLLSAFPVSPGDAADTIALARFEAVVQSDWGWWRTVTGSLERVRSLLAGEMSHHIPPGEHLDPIAQAGALL